jgi:hypothetical protein
MAFHLWRLFLSVAAIFFERKWEQIGLGIVIIGTASSIRVKPSSPQRGFLDVNLEEGKPSAR